MERRKNVNIYMEQWPSLLSKAETERQIQSKYVFVPPRGIREDCKVTPTFLMT
jgi:hypothetical protein